jgi:hypothetical protein
MKVCLLRNYFVPIKNYDANMIALQKTVRMTRSRGYIPSENAARASKDSAIKRKPARMLDCCCTDRGGSLLREAWEVAGLLHLIVVATIIVIHVLYLEFRA